MAEKYDCTIIAWKGFEDIAAAEVNELIGAKAAVADGAVEFGASLGDLFRLCLFSQSARNMFCNGTKVSPGLEGREYAALGGDDLPGSLAYVLLRKAGYTGKQFLFDPFTRSGSFAIEEALFSSGFPVNYYGKGAILSRLQKLPGFSKVSLPDYVSKKSPRPKILSSSQSMQDVRFAEKNAKLAGVNKLIRFSRLDIEWLDAKLDDKSVDLVLSYPPQFGSDNFAAGANARLEKTFDTFFDHATFFLKKAGNVFFVLRKGSYGKAVAAARACKFSAVVVSSFNFGSGEFDLVRFGR
ncbi:RNA methyltransferase [Candidatus Woesearchaeota archaeon]|nr:RNA methyltransferase [Candidatus Woesearchaeota archaeon]